VVDRAVRLRQPQLHTVLLERDSQMQELVTVEGPLILTDNNGIEPAVRIGDRGHDVAHRPPGADHWRDEACRQPRTTDNRYSTSTTT
jgi:hypothetical protein